MPWPCFILFSLIFQFFKGYNFIQLQREEKDLIKIVRVATKKSKKSTWEGSACKVQYEKKKLYQYGNRIYVRTKQRSFTIKGKFRQRRSTTGYIPFWISPGSGKTWNPFVVLQSVHSLYLDSSNIFINKLRLSVI